MIQQALSTIFREKVDINYAGRTDSGVHAFYQVIDFRLPFFIKAEDLLDGLNSILPLDIRILKVFEVNNDFHSRYSAKFREYVYFAYTGKNLAPFFRNYVWHIKQLPDLNRMREFSRIFVGKKDFSFVSNEGENKNCTREVYFFRVKMFRDYLIFHVRANGFLRGMVRNMVGLTIGYGLMRLQKDSRDNIIFKVGNLKSFKAPARGLFLRRVGY